MKISTLYIGFSLFFAFLLTSGVSGQSVTNGSVTGSPAANSGINNGYAPGWSGCNFSPDLCNVSFPSYSGNFNVTPVASPDGGTWLGEASLDECAQTTITGLTSGQTYTLYFCGANFGSGTTIFYGGPGQPRITIGASVANFSIPQAASTWGGYSMTFTANASSMVMQVRAPNVSGSYSNAGSYYVGLDGFSLTASASSCNVVLDVEWTKLSAYPADDQSVDVEWSVASETNFDYYTIERSFDGEVFEPLGERDAVGNSGEETAYQYADQAIPLSVWLNGGTLYYRVMQVSENGNATYSSIAVVTIPPAGHGPITLFPNPVQDQLDLFIETNGNVEKANVVVFTATGQKVIDENVSLYQGRIERPINVSMLVTGTYFLMVKTGSGKMFQRKFVVMD